MSIETNHSKHLWRDVAYAASLFAFLSAGPLALAQNTMGLPPCGTEMTHQALALESPIYLDNKSLFDAVWHQDMASSVSQEVYTIPMVVHVIHRGSPVGVEENISDGQILSAVHALNEDFRKVAGSNGDGLGVDVLVEFALAKRTPEGLPTTGIVRVDGSGVPGYAEHGIAAVSALPGADQVAVKSLTSWLGDDYLNVFVVPEINGNNAGGGIQGFAYTGPTGDVRDGVTLLYNVFGTEGTLKPGRTLNRTLTHEVGHHFSLLHTFADTDNCAEESNCQTQGDEVCDTPVTLENSSCASGTCPDAQLENYMDYTVTSCRNTFTAGQRTRMRTSLETVRSSLLESLGAEPVVAVDLRPVAINQASVCSPTWHPVLSVQNQGVLPTTGLTVHWSVEDIPLTPVSFPDSIPAGATLDFPLPEMLLPAPSTAWQFNVVAEGGTDANPNNDTLSQVLTYTSDDTWSLTLNTDFFANETEWSVEDSLGNALWSGGDYPFGASTYQNHACIPPGCHTLVVTDTGGDGLALGGSVLLQNAAGDTLAHIPQGTNFGNSIAIEACATTPAFYNLWQPSPENEENCEPCETPCPGDLNGDGLVQASDLLDFLVVFGLPCNP